MNFFRFNKNLFLLLTLFLILLFLQNLNKNSQQDPLTKSSHFLFSKVHTSLTNFHRAISNTVEKYFFLLSLREENVQLKEQNQKLKTKYQIFEEVLKENQRLKKLKDFSSNKAYQLLSAQILSTDFLSTNELLTINKGSSHGIKKFMGVLHPTGVVGHIFRVSPNSSQVLTLISPLSSLPARNQRSRIQGLVEAYQKNLLVFHYLGGQGDLQKSNQDLKVGDKVVVRQSDQIPPGFLIGHIQFLDNSQKELNPKVYIQPAVSFHALEEVLVVVKLDPPDRKTNPEKNIFEQKGINENKK